MSNELMEVKSNFQAMKHDQHKDKQEDLRNEIRESRNLSEGKFNECLEKLETMEVRTVMAIQKIEVIDSKMVESDSKKVTNKEQTKEDKHDDDEDDTSSEGMVDTIENEGAQNDSTKDLRNKDPKQTRKDDIVEGDEIWIIGTSIIKDLRPNKMYKNKRIRIKTLHDKTIEGASKFIESGKVKAKNILFQVGSNDLEEKSPDDVVKEVENLVKMTKQMLPHVNIIFSEIIPRYYNDINQLTQYEQKRVLYNILLKEYCNEIDAKLVNFGRMTANLFYDGIHFNEHGISVYVRQLKQVLNPLLGVSQNFGESSYSRSKISTEKRTYENMGKPNYIGYENKSNAYDWQVGEQRSQYNNRGQNGPNVYSRYNKPKDNEYSNHDNNYNMYELSYQKPRYQERGEQSQRYMYNDRSYHGNGEYGGYRGRQQTQNNTTDQKENMFKLFEYMLRSM